jgi:multidrug efflux system membrane fusion protein
MQASQHSPHHRWRWIAGGLIAVAVVIWFLAGSYGGAKRAGPPSPAPVTEATSEVRDMDITLTGLGTVTPVATVTVTSRVAGLLNEVDYQEGQIVKQNDLLAVIDPRPYQAAVTQAQGQLARDQAILTNAQLDLDRYRTAFQKHAIPEQQMATQEATVQEDKGIVQLDQGSLDAAKVNLDYARITSPITGRTGLRLVDAGNNVPANGTNGLVVITQLQPITVIFTLSQDAMAQVAAGARGGPLRVEALEHNEAKPIAEGKLLTWDNQIDPATGTFRLRAEFGNGDNALWPGEFVSIRLVTGINHGAITIPSRAIQSGPDGSYIFVIKPDQTVEMRAVEVAQSERGVTAIGKGLSACERVVVDGQYRLDQGTKVTIQEPGAAPKS